MASPFNVFRKNQKIMLAVTGMLAMISFVFLGPMMDVIGGGRGGYENPVMVKSVYGDLRASEIERMRLMQNILIEFQNRADQMRWEKQGRDLSQWRGRPANATQEDVVRNMLLAKKAESLGMVVSNDAINFRLAQYGLDEATLTSLVSGIRLGELPVRMHDIFEAYRIDLLADEVRRMYGSAMVPTPAEYWQQFLRLNQEVQIETIAVPAEDFLDQVDSPSEDELKAFFEKHKDTVNSPIVVAGVRMESPTPGFKIPQKAQFHYLKANYDAFVELASAEVTEKEIEEYYEYNKAQFEVLDLLNDKVEQPVNPDDPGPPEPKDEEAAPADEAPSDATPEKKEGEESPAPADSQPAPADDAPADKAPEGTEPEGTGNDAPKEEEAPKEKEQSALGGLEGAQFVSLLQNDEGAPADTAKPDEIAKPDENAKPEDNAKPADEAPPEDAAEKPAADDPAKPASDSEVPAAKEVPATDEKTDEKPAAEADPAKQPEVKKPDEKPKKYQPLAEVAGQIRETLGRRRAADKMISIMTPIADKLTGYWRGSVRTKLIDGKEGVDEFPAGLREKIDSSGLMFEKTDLLTPFELMDMPIGQATIDNSRSTIVDVAFSDRLLSFTPLSAQDDYGNRYLAWRVKLMPEQAPELADVRDEVIRAWKLPKALALAEAEAKRLADKARGIGVALDKGLADEKIEAVKSNPFTAFTRGNAPIFDFQAPLQLSEINGVAGAGSEFMDEVFNMKDGEIRVLTNLPKTVVYVVRLAGRPVPIDSLRQAFINSEREPMFAKPWAIAAMQDEMVQVSQALLTEVERDARLEWLVPPDQEEGR